MASVTSIYARAFADVVFEKRLDGGKILEQLRALSALLQANPDLRRVWENPAIRRSRRLLDASSTKAFRSQCEILWRLW
jgi:F0F1-type ATP synthase delta subunit